MAQALNLTLYNIKQQQKESNTNPTPGKQEKKNKGENKSKSLHFPPWAVPYCFDSRVTIIIAGLLNTKRSDRQHENGI